MKNYNENNNCVIGFKDIRLRLIGIPLISLVLPFLFFNSNQIEIPKIYFIFVGISLFYTSIYWHFDRAIIIYFRKKLDKPSEYKKRLFYQGIVIVIFTISFCYLIEVLINYPFKDYIPENGRVSFTKAISVGLIITSLIVSIYEAWYIFDLFKEGLIQNEVLKKENTETQLQTLKNQINPHFLFNSLNTLASVIPENQELAVQFVENLSKVYRYILQIKDKNLVTLSEELKCIEAYEYLLKIRFGDNITFTKTGFNGNKTRYLIPLSIQMLIENSIKHNVVSTSKPLHIVITANEDSLSVKNNLQLKTSIEISTKTGLINIQKRFQILTKQTIQIKESTTVFEVIIPLVKIGEALWKY